VFGFFVDFVLSAMLPHWSNYHSHL